MSGGQEPGRAMKLLLGGAAGFSVISALPLVAERLGVQFLPDPQVHAHWGVALIALALLMALGVALLLRMVPTRGLTFRTLRVIAPLIYVLIFYMGLTTAVPMVWTTVVGSPAIKVVTVAHPAGTPTSRCRPAVQLADMPLLFDRLCNVPPTFLMSLVPGDKVMLIGRGSRLGVFYDEVRLLPRGTEL